MTLTEDQILENCFEDIIGQDGPKRKLKFFLESYRKTRYFPSLSIAAPKGQGKTKFARAIARGLFMFNDRGRTYNVPSQKNKSILVPARKPFLEINCASIKNINEFVNTVLVKNVIDKDVTIFFDEASEIPRDVSMALLTILENNTSKKTQYIHDEYICDIDLRRQTFIFATSENHKVFHALSDRLEELSLQEYTHEHLAQMIKLNLLDTNISDDLLLEISSVLRGNARAAIKMADKIKIYLNQSQDFSFEDWKKLKHILTILPLGINNMELTILKYLEQSPKGMSLTCLAAKTGLSREQLRLDSELYLIKNNLMNIDATGRRITGDGIKLLKSL